MPNFVGCRCCKSDLFASRLPGGSTDNGAISVRKQKRISRQSWSADVAPLYSSGQYGMGYRYLPDGTVVEVTQRKLGVFKRDGTCTVTTDQTADRLAWDRNIDFRGGRLFVGLYPTYGLDPDGTVTTFNVPNTYKNNQSTLFGDINKNLVWLYNGADHLVHVAQYDAVSGDENWTVDLPFTSAWTAVAASLTDYPGQYSLGRPSACADNDGNVYVCMTPQNYMAGYKYTQYAAIFKITSSGSVSVFCDFSTISHASIFGASSLAFNEFNGSIYLSMIGAPGGVTYTSRVIRILPDGSVSSSYLDFPGYVTGDLSCSRTLGYVFGVFQNYAATQWHLRVYNPELISVIDESGTAWFTAKCQQS